MARFEFRLPDIGEGVAEGEVTQWHVKAGDAVAEDQPMVEVMTDKATVTIGAPRAGRISELLADVGSTVDVGEVLVVIETESAGSDATAGSNGSGAPAAGSTAPESEPAASAVGDLREVLPGTGYLSEAGQQPRAHLESGVVPAPSAAEPSGYFSPRPLATPATRKLARDLGIDLRRVPPSGAHGRVTSEDVRGSEERLPTPGAAPRAGSSPPSPPRPTWDASGTSPEQRVPFVGLRRKIAERLQYSKNTAAHFTFVEECNAERLVELRDRLKAKAAERGVALSFLPVIAKAVVSALRRHPMLNSTLDTGSNELVLRDHVHLGIAAATDQGLMVPVIPHAERLSVLELGREIQRLGQGARSGELASSELAGSTFTITSLGKQSGLFATPVINPPEVAILGVHRIKERPVVHEGRIVPGQVMLLTLSLDHRIVDGHVGAAFLYDVIEQLEEPASMLLDTV
ncbi:MAG: 2-oxo acid dehydrogenase subunit E2 [Proteobacteria bacterium]|nr:2-oxo acid dehydrogenase subunit E2 [Pseudomonadota bacterium]